MKMTASALAGAWQAPNRMSIVDLDHPVLLSPSITEVEREDALEGTLYTLFG
jgi:hypothetical protein